MAVFKAQAVLSINIFLLFYWPAALTGFSLALHSIPGRLDKASSPPAHQTALGVGVSLQAERNDSSHH